jgi:stearoyl-CoA desaturase (delta-9 desaturase)
VFLLAGVRRLVISHHFTLLINSLIHIWSRRSYRNDRSASTSIIVRHGLDGGHASVFPAGDG